MKKFLSELWSKKLVRIITVVGLVYLLIPILVDWLIIGNSFPSNVENSDWIAFLGGYIGGAFSLIGIGLTIWYTSREAHKDRALACAPFLVIDKAVISVEDDFKVVGVFNCEGRNFSSHNLQFDIDIMNQGNGTAILIDIYDIQLHLSYGKEIISEIKTYNLSKCIPPKEKVTRGLMFLIPGSENDKYDPVYGVIRFKVKYLDLLQTAYFQIVNINLISLKNSNDDLFNIYPYDITYEYPQKLK